MVNPKSGIEISRFSFALYQIFCIFAIYKKEL